MPLGPNIVKYPTPYTHIAGELLFDTNVPAFGIFQTQIGPTQIQ